MSIPTPEYIVIGGKRLVCDTYVADDGQTYYVPTDKIAFGTNAGAAVDTGNPMPTLDAQVHSDLAELAVLHGDLANVLTGPLATKGAGIYGYHAGAAAATIDVPAGARITRVSVLAGTSAAATVQILGGDTITVAAGGAFDETISGDALATVSTSEVIVGGTAQAYYVAWAS